MLYFKVNVNEIKDFSEQGKIVKPICIFPFGEKDYQKHQDN